MADIRLVSERTRFTPEPYLSIQPSSIPWLVKGALPNSGVAFLVGSSKAGKSFLAIDTSLRIASGQEVFGRRVRQVGVTYVAAEDAAGCRSRVAAWRKSFVPDYDLAFDLIGEPVNLLDPESVTELIDGLRASKARFEDLGCPLGLVVFDTLSRCLPGVDENNSQDMSRAFTVLKRIGSYTGALTLVLAHFGKAGEERGIRGWSGMDANSDATITLERDKENDALRILTLSKVKNGPDGAQLSFQLANVELGVDDDGDAITSCVVEFTGTPPLKEKKRKSMSAPETLVFTAVKFVLDHEVTQPVPIHIPGVRSGTVGVSRAQIRTQAHKTGLFFEGESENASRMRLNRALVSLQGQGRIRMENDLIWLIS